MCGVGIKCGTGGGYCRDCNKENMALHGIYMSKDKTLRHRGPGTWGW